MYNTGHCVEQALLYPVPFFFFDLPSRNQTTQTPYICIPDLDVALKHGGLGI